jgi:hypothetical protein
MPDYILLLTFCVISFRTYPSGMLLPISDLLLGIYSSCPVCGNAPVACCPLSGMPSIILGF